jgi:hypothetical protein
LLLSELTAATPRLALVGLAKNTGKTVALTTLVRELRAAGRPIGVTSVGRDGEQHDVIDARIEKPLVLLSAGSIVATTDQLLRSSGLAHELLRRTDFRTPLGRVLIARLDEAGTIEVAGPGAAAEVRAAADEMLALGAAQVLIDGAVDRRAASSPEIADGLVVSTGAVLSGDLAEVVSRTTDAVELARIGGVEEAAAVGAPALAGTGGPALLGDGMAPVELEPRFALTADAADIGRMLDSSPGGRRLLLAGALPEPFVRELAVATRRRGRELDVIVPDSTKVFLSERGPGWYARQGVHLRALHPISLLALTVNPVAPRSHQFDSARLRELLAAAIPDVPIFDVMDPGYAAAQPVGS